ncbi:Putative HTH-type transcriptional regulator [Nonomuraea coxensis DSM 45129]|uniref:HTH-type transcriptional regulator n=1 Tax=Nonomuraea coxensis DSM 45129 TaxID=1122611 RepID=A0ABX8TZL8_9ACTN|nr:Putative HTH-type transcriptional regulator [Nonomuraea coxensis DSM 45129]
MTEAAEAEISRREAEVLELVGDHLSNAEIAARLCISVRTVESHVSSLLRKLEVPDRRALARRAPGPGGAASDRPAAVLPAPLTSFVGRARERAELAALLKEHRQVTAVGPGGVGKTRLALAVAAEAAGAYPDGVWFADLVPVTDPGMIAAAVAGALGLGEQPGRDLADSVAAALADRDALVVLDNCEHVMDGVAPFLERLLATCPRLTVLATSRARLMVPFERVYPVPPLSLAADGDSDAVALFMERAAAVGRPPDPALRGQIAAVCARLDGMALAIELAAARCPTLGLDGITAALSHPLRMLTGGSRADERHRSVRAALDWSHALLEPAHRALLRRVSVFAAPFTAAAAAEVAGYEECLVADGLARLAEQSLLVVAATPDGTEYRALETIRQYAAERLAEAGERDEVHSRHLRWCLARAAWLEEARPGWRARFDQVADDLRAALTWAAGRPELREDAFGLARRLAELAFTRNLTGESQRRFEQAAALAAGPAESATMLRQAASVAGCRAAGDDMYRLRLAAAAAARRAGDAAGAAADLATAATMAFRYWATFVRVPSREEALALMAEARQTAGGDQATHAADDQATPVGGEPGAPVGGEPGARAALALAEAAVVTDAFGAVQGPADNVAVPETIACAERAVELAARTGDPLAESAALDALTCAHIWAGDAFAAAARSRRRVTLLSALPPSPAVTHELIDALGMVTEAGLGAGDVPDARRWARQLDGHPSLAEVGHRAPLMVDALAGDVEEVLAGSVRLLDAWRRAGSPARAHLGPAVAAVAMVHGLRDDHDAERAWREILDRLDVSAERAHGYAAVFDGMLLLHRGQAREAAERMAPEAGEVWKWVSWIWHHWYVALRTEAVVLAGHSGARRCVAEARAAVAGNPVAEALVARAGAVLDGDREALLATADAFDAAGCPYQSARTLLLAGGEHAGRGSATLAALGLAPKAVSLW